MPLELPEELERYVSAAVENGEFASREELIADAVRLHRDYAAKLQSLRDDLQVAIDELDRGEGYEFRNEQELHEFFEEIAREGRKSLAERKAS
ncbi:MAG: type II toxin-antitoxin system ParD family antitoxin [Planctomycetaceae bacterium]